MKEGQLFDERITRLIEVGCIGAVFILYALLKARTLRLGIGDSGLWFYAAKLWAEGVIPYRDFFMSHPPLQILLPAAIIALFGVSLPLLQLIPGIASGFSGWLVFRIARKEWGFLAGFIAALLFLFGVNQLIQSSHFTGANLSLTFLLLGIDLFLSGRPFGAGVVLGIGTGVGVYVFPGFLLLSLFALLTEKERFRPLVKGCASFLVPLHLLFLLLAGRAFLDDVYLYHLHKVAESPHFPNVASVIVSFLYAERFLFLLVLFAAHLALFSPPSPLLRVMLLFFLDYLLFFALQPRAFAHYLIFLLPFAAIASACALLSLLRLRPSFLSERMKHAWAAFMGLAGASGLAAYLLLSVAPYSRIAATNRLTGIEEIISHIQQTLAPEETLYGDFTIAPTIALLSGRRIAADEAESSVMRFESGFSPIKNTLQKIEEDRVGAVIAFPHLDMHAYLPFHRYLERYYTLEKLFPGLPDTPVEFWKRRQGVAFEG